MNATTILNDLQYIIDKKSRYLQHCKDKQKECKALEIELTTLVQAKELLENLAMQQQEAEQQLDKARETIKSAEQASLIAKAVWCQANSEIWYKRTDFCRELLRIFNEPKAVISEWKYIVQSMKVDEREIERLEQRLNYYDPVHYAFYKTYLQDCFIDIKIREKQWREKTDKRNLSKQKL